MTTQDDCPDQQSPRRGGRPHLPKGERRSHLVGVVVNERERADLQARARTAGIADVATYMRQAVLAQRPPRAVVPEANRAAWGELARATAALSEIAAHLRDGDRLDARDTPRVTRALEDLREELQRLRAALIGPAPGEDDDG